LTGAEAEVEPAIEDGVVVVDEIPDDVVAAVEIDVKGVTLILSPC
jgi:hypothetical protein